MIPQSLLKLPLRLLMMFILVKEKTIKGETKCRIKVTVKFVGSPIYIQVYNFIIRVWQLLFAVERHGSVSQWKWELQIYGCSKMQHKKGTIGICAKKMLPVQNQWKKIKVTKSFGFCIYVDNDECFRYINCTKAALWCSLLLRCDSYLEMCLCYVQGFHECKLNSIMDHETWNGVKTV